MAMRLGLVGSMQSDGSLAASPGIFWPESLTLTCRPAWMPLKLSADPGPLVWAGADRESRQAKMAKSVHLIRASLSFFGLLAPMAAGITRSHFQSETKGTFSASEPQE